MAQRLDLQNYVIRKLSNTPLKTHKFIALCGQTLKILNYTKQLFK
jgi:hypothetical protein